MEYTPQENSPELAPAKKSNSRFIFWILIVIFGVIFLASAFIVGKYLLESKNNKQMQQDLIDMRPTTGLPTLPTGSTGSTGPTHSTNPSVPSDPTDPSTTPPPTTEPLPTEPQILEDLLQAYERNNHLVGWIYIPGTENASQGFSGINYPVLQTPNVPEWHNYYLYRNFDGEDDKHGWIYVREACDVFAPCDNIVIYGHNMADGTMFGQVVNYRFRDYYEEHKYIYFDTLYERHIYEIVAVFLTSGTTGVGYSYHSKNNFDDAEDFNAFMDAIKGGDSRVKLYYHIDNTAEYGDKLITLSTCWKEIEDGRLVVVAKQIA